MGGRADEPIASGAPGKEARDSASTKGEQGARSPYGEWKGRSVLGAESRSLPGRAAREPRIVLLPRRMSTLQSRLRVLADTFASGVLEAIRGASLEELVSAPANGRAEGRSVPAKPAPGAAASPRRSPSSKSAKKAGRLPRRSPEDIAKVLAQVVALVKSEKQGLRAEEIRAKLGVQRKEMPRVLKEGIARKQLKAKGQKRSTTYSAP